MCPACIANIALIVAAAGATSSGDLSRTRTLIRRISGRTKFAINGKEKHEQVTEETGSKHRVVWNSGGQPGAR
jgi:hypothetical protein